MHSPAAVCASNILDWLPEGTMSHDLSRMGFEELRNKIIDGDMKLDFGGGGSPEYQHADLHIAGPPCV